MFKFDDYPEIKEAKKEYERLISRKYSLDIKEERSNNTICHKRARKLYEIARDEFTKYELSVYAKIIFDTFSQIKPIIRNLDRNIWHLDSITNEYSVIGEKPEFENWDEFFSGAFEGLNTESKSRLVHLVENATTFALPPPNTTIIVMKEKKEMLKFGRNITKN